MCLWLEVKQERKKKSFDQVIREYLKKQEEDKKQIQRKQQKEKNTKKASGSGDQQANHITKDQFVFLYDSIQDIKASVSNHKDTMEKVEQKLIEVNDLRKQVQDQKQAQKARLFKIETNNN